MSVIILITQENREVHPKLLEQMFEDRKRIFVDLFKWDVPVSEGRLEIDEFDNEEAVYLIATDGDGSHLGSLRLLHTDRPHILGSLFSELCEHDVPAGETTMEITRLCLSLRLRADERLVVRNRLISAMVDYCIQRGISALTGVVAENFREKVMDMGWNCAPLGPALLIGDSRLGAFEIAINDDTPGLLAENGIYSLGGLSASSTEQMGACIAELSS